MPVSVFSFGKEFVFRTTRYGYGSVSGSSVLFTVLESLVGLCLWLTVHYMYCSQWQTILKSWDNGQFFRDWFTLTFMVYDLWHSPPHFHLYVYTYLNFVIKSIKYSRWSSFHLSSIDRWPNGHMIYALWKPVLCINWYNGLMSENFVDDMRA